MLREADAAEAFRLRQAQKLLDLFEGAHGRPAITLEELEHWVGSAEGKAVLADHHTREGKIIPD